MIIYVDLGNTKQERFHNYRILSESIKKDGGCTDICLRPADFDEHYFFIAQKDRERLYYALIRDENLDTACGTEILMSSFELFDMSGVFDWYRR